MANPLKGKALAEFVENGREEFGENGDALCVAAGYGKKALDGTTKCNLPAFVNELDQVSDLVNDKADSLNQGFDV